MQKLQELADARAQEETAVAATLQSELKGAEDSREVSLQRLAGDMAHDRRDLENQYAAAKNVAAEKSRLAKKQLQADYDRWCLRADLAFKQTALAIERKKKESEWQTLAVFDAAKDSPQQMLDAAGRRFHARRLQVDGLQRDASTLMAMRRLAQAAELVDPAPENAVPGPAPDDSVEVKPTAEECQQICLNQLHQEVLRLQAQRLPSLMLEGLRFVGWWLLACVVSAVLTGLPTGWSPGAWLVAAFGVGTLVTVVAYWLLGKRAQNESLHQYAQILATLARSRSLEQEAQTEAEVLSRKAAEDINLRKHNALATAGRARDAAVQQNNATLQAELRQAESERDVGLQEATDECQRAQAAADKHYPPLLDLLSQDRQLAEQEHLARYEARKTAAQETHETSWQSLAAAWQNGFQAISKELAAMEAACNQYFPDWSTTSWEDWQRPAKPPPAIQFGHCQLPLQAVKHGISADSRLVPAQTEIQLPALMAMDELPGLAITASGRGQAVACELLRAMMVRFLTVMPAGKLRFTIIDPSALGENFATFMQLADYDEQLVGGQIWTDSRKIDERLMLLSDHMEKVLQKYLRNDFESIHDYNAQAGEVAEPYQVLVVANAPVGLSDAALRRLNTIAKMGPRCGVYTLLSIDGSRKLPSDLDLDELLGGMVHLEWVEDRLRWNYPLYEKLPLYWDRLPPRQQLGELLRATGQESRLASRVEVPFSVVAPQNGNMWAGSTARELVVPVGCAGANDLQTLRLGRGTAQHALISGKTGSGKSTLLHALITNLALHYSPDEVEFYLVDFKKGVEFKAYATGELPHARVIAIESEREFGVSVLERLDEELRQRGDLFRRLGAQDLAGARSAGDQRLPRVLLIVDEFQELFVTDDKLAQDAALLLDRLVRQGRAFGIHVLLGSQTLAGAYSLARSTIGQMAVRIALECSEADAHLILSDENTAARLLNRPGEAIYNDQNGLLEGNSPFQVVWLPNQDRQHYLAEIRSRHAAGGDSHEPAIVFEGNVPADPSANEALVSTVERFGNHDMAEPTIWLGSAVRIEPPTELTLRRQGGNHLLVVGQDEPLALGILASALVALAAQGAAGEARYTVLDGSRPESADQGAWEKIVAALPKTVKRVEPSSAEATITALAEEVTRRSESSGATHPPYFLIVHDLAQFRALRLTEDDYSFSSFDASGTNGHQVPIAKQFRNLLREGPSVGVHVLLWCDSYNTLTRFLDRLTLREVDYRVALQMSAGDSTSFIDSPAAGHLGEHRALLYRDDLGTQVKFRPYGRPTAQWLGWVSSCLVEENCADPQRRLNK
ncbi:MAG: AAA family ATPase [Pirellulales bacterium]|nr:AAA family ATPase [Pirellulales bacterium]